MTANPFRGTWRIVSMEGMGRAMGYRLCELPGQLNL